MGESARAQCSTARLEQTWEGIIDSALALRAFSFLPIPPLLSADFLFIPSVGFFSSRLPACSNLRIFAGTRPILFFI